jgi:hypothetical protein
MHKRVIIKIILTIGFIMLLIVGWFSYTLSNYDTFFLPHYLIGLSNSDKYYRENISDYLLKNGREFKVDDIDTSNWKTYKSEKNGFSFRYPNDSEILNEDSGGVFIGDKEVSKYFINKESLCRFSIYNDGWAVSLPRTRTFLHMQDPLYYILHDNTAYMIQNLINDDIEKKIDSGKLNKSVEIIFFKEGWHIFASFKGNCRADLFKGILSTVEF